jgi:NAD(P)-dependent dehydrogenase (short-subunit alcohol dehydrogenase family)
MSDYEVGRGKPPKHSRFKPGAIAPSVTPTDRLRKRLENDPSVQKIAAAHLVGLAEPVDIARAALYLASDEARMITGQILRVDSGITIV